MLHRAPDRNEHSSALLDGADTEIDRDACGLSLTTRLAIAMITLVAIAVFAVGYLSYRSLEQTLLPRVLDRIETHTKLITTDLQSYVRGARADVATISTYAAAHGMMLARLNGGIDPEDHVSWAAWRRRLELHLAGQPDQEWTGRAPNIFESNGAPFFYAANCTLLSKLNHPNAGLLLLREPDLSHPTLRQKTDDAERSEPLTGTQSLLV